MKVVILYIFCRFLIFVTAQGEKSTQELLMSTHWEPQDFFYEVDCGYVRYTKTEFVTEMKIDGELRVFSYSYYLSSSPDTVFDSNKVGKNSSGKYIIEKGVGYVFISEILELTATKLVVKNLTQGFTTTGKVTTYLPTNMKL
ncbi:hypothetical protein [uncultured Bacteroides sp.]|uniref:hypothetical protein n=1 Tax=uncultured Bacteroides sp. TaxID=162156 RepID=UPI00260C1D9A|nr:hypothetical protein [uncultured Bacteroides sp.]